MDMFTVVAEVTFDEKLDALIASDTQGLLDYDEEDYQDFYAAPGWCDNYVVHEAHVYTALNGESYSCTGFTLVEFGDLLFEEAQPPCEHGMSASLCNGPMHY